MSLSITIYKSDTATKFTHFKLYHMQALYLTLKTVQSIRTEARSKPLSSLDLKQNRFFDASMREDDTQKNLRQGMSILRKSASTIPTIFWASELAKAIARRMSTAELLSTADSVEESTYLKAVLEKIVDSQTTDVFIESKSTLYII